MSLEVSWGRASNSLNFDLQVPGLSRSAAGLSGFPLLFPTAVQADYVPDFIFAGGRTANAGRYQTNQGPFTNENVTHDVVANLTKVWGSHASKAGFYFQSSFKPQSDALYTTVHAAHEAMVTTTIDRILADLDQIPAPPTPDEPASNREALDDEPSAADTDWLEALRTTGISLIRRLKS